MRCPACGLEADPTAGLCPHCRTPLHMPPGTHPPGGAQLSRGTQPGGSHPGGISPGGISPGGPQSWPASGYQIIEPGSGPGIRRYPWIWVVVVLAVLFVAAGVTGVVLKVWHKVPNLPGVVASARPSPSAKDGRSQAMAIDALLTASSKSRGQLGPALDQVEKCGDLNAATATLQQVVTERDGQVRAGQGLAVDQLDQGEQLRTLLVQALTYSLQADQSFVTWAKNASNGCTGKANHDADYAKAQAASSGATTSKQSFVKLWNPIATKYDLPTRSESSF
jgi:Predicted membrane protein